MRKVLITNQYFSDYSGSEIVSLELTKWFLENDYEVHLFAIRITDPLLSVLKELKVKITTDESELDEDYDLVWLHHFLMPSFLLKANTAKVVFHHMSGTYPLELPLIPNLEKDLADLVLSNSEETRDQIKEVYDLESEVFGNPAPTEFLSSLKSTSTKVEKVTVISNHIPSELRETIELLKKSNVEVDVLGIDENNFALVTPKIIQKSDLIISIGKTIQYAILSNTPVYCYDHFGGPGFLDAGNYEKAKYFNFSGRGFNKKTSEHILEEIIGTPYIEVKNDFTEIATKAKSDFNLDTKMRKLIKDLNSMQPKRKKIADTDVLTYTSVSKTVKECFLVLNHYKGLANHYKTLLDESKADKPKKKSLISTLKGYLKR